MRNGDRMWVLVAVVVLVESAAPAASAQDEGPRGAMVLVGSETEYTPFVTLGPKEMLLQARMALAARLEEVSAFQVDRSGSEIDSGFVTDLRARFGLTFDTRRAIAPVALKLELEVDAFTGVVTGAPEGTAGVGLPFDGGYDHVIRNANLRFSVGPYLHVIGGYMTSQWGMGIVANAGNDGWAPGSAVFNDPRDGDRVLRVMLASGPTTPAHMFVGVGWDWVQSDDIMLEGDEAKQLVGALRFGLNQDWGAGAYVVWRQQEAADGATLDAIAVDLIASGTIRFGDGMSLKLEAEGALITGETTLAPSVDFPTHDVLQLGAAFRASFGASVAGAVLDILYASGDQNLDDKTQNGFKADRNYQLGFILFRQVLAAQTGRAPITASDPLLTGVPAEDLDRFPTRGSMTNTIAIFPRGWYRPIDGLEIYGGPLIALSEVSVIDLLETRTNGGVAHNALGGSGSNYLGTEIDLGIRWRALLAGSQLTVGLEGGVLIPGAGLQNATGETMGPVYGGRFMLDYAL